MDLASSAADSAISKPSRPISFFPPFVEGALGTIGSFISFYLSLMQLAQQDLSSNKMILIIDYFAPFEMSECPKLSILHVFRSDPAERDASPRAGGKAGRLERVGLISGQAIRFTDSDLGFCTLES